MSMCIRLNCFSNYFKITENVKKSSISLQSDNVALHVNPHDPKADFKNTKCSNIYPYFN